jgi:hypothetical protein
LTEPNKKRRERRRSRRFLSSVRCLITGQQSALYTPLRNISRGGLSVAGPTPFSEGEEISVRIPGDHRTGEIIVRSRVIWKRGRGDPSPIGMGAEFLEVTAGQQALEEMLRGKEGENSRTD